MQASVRLSRSEDRVQVKLIDGYGDVYFNQKARIANLKEMEQLKQNLRTKGFDF